MINPKKSKYVKIIEESIGKFKFNNGLKGLDWNEEEY